MRRAKVKRYRRIHQSLDWGWGYRALIRVGLRLLISLLPLLPFIAIAIIFLLPKTPHLRVSYTYTGSSSHPNYIDCQYLGVHGMVRNGFALDCPLVAFIRK